MNQYLEDRIFENRIDLILLYAVETIKKYKHGNISLIEMAETLTECGNKLKCQQEAINIHEI